jgi:hypothetical protein
LGESSSAKAAVEVVICAVWITVVEGIVTRAVVISVVPCPVWEEAARSAELAMDSPRSFGFMVLSLITGELSSENGATYAMSASRETYD